MKSRSEFMIKHEQSTLHLILGYNYTPMDIGIAIDASVNDVVLASILRMHIPAAADQCSEEAQRERTLTSVSAIRKCLDDDSSVTVRMMDPWNIELYCLKA